MKLTESVAPEINLDREISDDEWNDLLDEARVKPVDEEKRSNRLSMEELMEVEYYVPKKKFEKILYKVLPFSLLASVITLLLGWLLFPNRWWIVLIVLVVVCVLITLTLLRILRNRVNEFIAIKAAKNAKFDIEAEAGLDKDEVDDFYHLWVRFLYALNEKHQIVPSFKIPGFGAGSVDPEITLAFRDVLWKNLEWFDDIITNKENYDFTLEELAILQEWKEKHISSKFFISEYQEAYSVFSDPKEPLKLYGVCALLTPFDELIPSGIMPAYGKAVLLPYKGRIVYDGALEFYQAKKNSPNQAKNYNPLETYDRAYKLIKESHGVISNL